MTVLDDDVAAARRAVASLERLAQTLAAHGDTVDGLRLQADVGRLGADLDLLCGAAPVAPVSEAPVAAREVIPDTSYTHDFWMDAEDEGLGSRRGC